MKRIFTLLAIVLCVGSTAKAGYEITFCNKPNSEGKCADSLNEFKWNGDKNELFVIVQTKDSFSTTKVNLKVFLMKNDREGELAAELSVYPKPKAKNVVKRIYLFKPGYYKVDALDVNNKLLCSGFLTLSDR